MKQISFIRSNAPRHWVGDGFPVRSVFSYNDSAQALSPFLLLDHAGPASFDPVPDVTARRRGVGQHPHRGFETVSIVYDGEVEHRDSTGAGGRIGPGDVQWMTAARGIVHEEYHGADYARTGGPFHMVQLWVNLPARDKMVEPGYQELRDAQMPRIPLPGGAGTLRLIAGRYRGDAGDATGPARTFSPVDLWDLRLAAGHRVELKRPEGHTTAMMVLQGALQLSDRDGVMQRVGAGELVGLERAGDTLAFDVTEDALVLLLGGEPLNEPVVGHGPFVMNTSAEILQAFEDFKAGRFVQPAAGATAP